MTFEVENPFCSAIYQMTSVNDIEPRLPSGDWLIERDVWVQRSSTQGELATFTVSIEINVTSDFKILPKWFVYQLPYSNVESSKELVRITDES